MTSTLAPPLALVFPPSFPLPVPSPRPQKKHSPPWSPRSYSVPPLLPSPPLRSSLHPSLSIPVPPLLLAPLFPPQRSHPSASPSASLPSISSSPLAPLASPPSLARAG